MSSPSQGGDGSSTLPWDTMTEQDFWDWVKHRALKDMSPIWLPDGRSVTVTDIEVIILYPPLVLRRDRHGDHYERDPMGY